MRPSNIKMQALRRIGDLSRLSRAQLFRFGEQNKLEMSVDAQKAVWARTIIKTIETSKPSDDIFAPSLRDILTDLPDPSPEYHFDQAIKKEMLKFFGEGVNLSHSFIMQDRMHRARETR